MKIRLLGLLALANPYFGIVFTKSTLVLDYASKDYAKLSKSII